MLATKIGYICDIYYDGIGYCYAIGISSELDDNDCFITDIFVI